MKTHLTDSEKSAALKMAPWIWPSQDEERILYNYLYYSLSPEADQRRREWQDGPDIGQTFCDARELLLPGVLAMEARFQEISRQWPYVFSRSLSQRDGEYTVEMRWLGLAQLKTRGNRGVLDRLAGGERFVYNTEHMDVGLGALIKSHRFDDDSYQEDFARLSMGLAESCVHSEEILHANVLSLGHCYNPSIGADGVPLFSQKHPYDHGVYSNLVRSELSVEAIEAVSVLMRRALPDQAGKQTLAHPKALIVPIELEATAMRMMRHLNDKGMAGLLPEGYVVLDYLTDPKTWFVQSNVLGLVSMQRKPFRLDFFRDDQDLVVDASQRYGVGYFNPRAVFAGVPAGHDI